MTRPFRSIGGHLHYPDPGPSRPIRATRVESGGTVHTQPIAWMSSTCGHQWDGIDLNRMPATDAEREWVLDILPTRLRPGGVLRAAAGEVIVRVPGGPA